MHSSGEITAEAIGVSGFFQCLSYEWSLGACGDLYTRPLPTKLVLVSLFWVLDGDIFHFRQPGTVHIHGRIDVFAFGLQASASQFASLAHRVPWWVALSSNLSSQSQELRKLQHLSSYLPRSSHSPSFAIKAQN